LDWKWLIVIIGALWVWSQMKPTQAVTTDKTKVGLPGLICPICGAEFGPVLADLEKHMAQVHGLMPTSPASGWVLVRAYKGPQLGMTTWIPPENVPTYLAGDWVLA